MLLSHLDNMSDERLTMSALPIYKAAVHICVGKILRGYGRFGSATPYKAWLIRKRGFKKRICWKAGQSEWVTSLCMPTLPPGSQSSQTEFDLSAGNAGWEMRTYPAFNPPLHAN